MIALNNFLLVEPCKVEVQESSSGLLLSGKEVTKQRYQEGIVVVSSEHNGSIKKGDKIVYDAVQGHDYRSGESMYRMIQYRDVALVL
jgi:co-chaperonin GroES (HSP10)